MNWYDVLELQDVNLANSLLEDKISSIMDSEAPLKIIQSRTIYNNWLTVETKNEMLLRDKVREKAKATDRDEDWLEYRCRRNKCTQLQKKDKSDYYKRVYSSIEKEKDSAEAKYCSWYSCPCITVIFQVLKKYC